MKTLLKPALGAMPSFADPTETSVQRHHQLPILIAHRMHAHGVLGRLQAFAGGQVEVVLVDGRGDDDALCLLYTSPSPRDS